MRPSQLAAFLHTLTRERPLGLHDTTIGFNHVRKVVVMEELGEVVRHSEVLQTAVGFRGTVAIGFSSPSSACNLKVICDQPTDEHKRGEFPGVDGVPAKYSQVHEINRTGSMLDNVVIAQPQPVGFAGRVATLSTNASSKLRRNRGLSPIENFDSGSPSAEATGWRT